MHRLPGKGWRDHIGEEGAEWLLTKTIQAGQSAGVIDDDSLARVSVDTTVMEKNIAYPTPSRQHPADAPAGQWTLGSLRRLG